jgi:hypothetical protein
MRDWQLVLFPVGIVIYFLVYPNQLSAFITWAEGLIH